MGTTSMKIKKWKSSQQLIAEGMRQARMAQKSKNMFEGFAVADLLLEAAKVALVFGVKGTNFRNPKMAQKIDKVLALLSDVQKSELGKVIILKDSYADVMENEHAAEIFRLIHLMGFYPTEHLAEFNDGLEKQHKEGGVQNA